MPLVVVADDDQVVLGEAEGACRGCGDGAGGGGSGAKVDHGGCVGLGVVSPCPVVDDGIKVSVDGDQ